MTLVSVRATLRAATGAALLWYGLTPAYSQGRGGSDWSTSGGDAHRSAWVRTDPKISAASMGGPGFQMMWKMKLQAGSLLQPVLMERYIGYRGFRSYVFVADAANKVIALDSDLARVEWEKKFPVAAQAGSAGCPGGMTGGVSERTSAAFPVVGGGRGGGGGGRGGPAKSGVGQPGEGAVTLSAMAAAPAAPARGANPGALPNAAAAGRGRMPSYLTVLTSDGVLHNIYVSNGEEPTPPVRLVPANANVSGLIVVDDVTYAVTTGNCGGAPNGVWALEGEAKTAASWKGNAIGIAFGPDGTVYASTSDGELVALDGKTLAKKGSYQARQPFTSHPIVFEVKGKAMVAAATRDGAIHVADGTSLAKSAVSASTKDGGSALATWQDAGGNAWILHGNTAWKLGAAGLEAGWTANGANAVSAASVVNGVVFLASGGSASSNAVLHAVDAGSGKALWTSGNTIGSYMGAGAGLASGGSTVYLGTHDGTIWAFGFPIEH